MYNSVVSEVNANVKKYRKNHDNKGGGIWKRSPKTAVVVMMIASRDYFFFFFFCC